MGVTKDWGSGGWIPMDLRIHVKGFDLPECSGSPWGQEALEKCGLMYILEGERGCCLEGGLSWGRAVVRVGCRVENEVKRVVVLC